MDSVEVLVACVVDAVGQNPKPDWRQSLITACDTVESEYDELLVALKLLFKAWDCNWIHPDERAQIYKQVLSAIERAEPKT
tara:strand:+ start:41 stop:283 length:243 start_codon:yes stop_codon:yes gene_type:complete